MYFIYAYTGNKSIITNDTDILWQFLIYDVKEWKEIQRYKFFIRPNHIPDEDEIYNLINKEYKNSRIIYI